MNRDRLALKVQSVAADLARYVPSTGDRPLADPPAESGLLPVPGSPGMPVLGETLALVADTLGWAQDRHARYGDVSWFDAFGTSLVLVLGPDAIGEVLANRQRVYSNAEGWGYFLVPFFERGIMLMDGEEHLHHRRILQQAFSRERLVGYLERMNPVIAQGIAEWEPQHAFQVQPAVKQLALNVATDVFLGVKLGSEAEPVDQAFIDLVHATGSIVRFDVPGGAWRRGLVARRYLEDFLSAQVTAKRAGAQDDLFSVLTRAQDEEGNTFADVDVVNHLIFVLMAAHDTSTITATMMCYLLGRHPEWQQRLREESRALGKDFIEYGDIEALTGLDLVMKETLRMYSPVALSCRRAVADTELAGHYIPAGTRLMLGVQASHRLEPWWTNPDTFDPERFAEPRREDKLHKNAFNPFGGGVHKCIGMFFGGMEVKALMHQLLLTHTWSVAPDYHPPIRVATGPTPVDGLPVRLRRIQPSDLPKSRAL
ncbi:cytochrome P450 [Antrihabitans stalactiti]|uniref:Cytochrome P450 n=1 Tax=Antrihabitans stalactiti TaxID=2584121 RepID=A0A848KDS4_9NOCA|nr:cytochrome P450 [Antrihabitans stalactiti]NMN95906.1 cytochrome P450 [Antrihabitans stalactiti]